MTKQQAFELGYLTQMDYNALKHFGHHEAAEAKLEELRSFVRSHETSIVHAYKRGVMAAEAELLSTQTETSGTGQS